MRRIFRRQKNKAPKRPEIPHHESRYPDGLICDTSLEWGAIVWGLIAGLSWFGEEVSPASTKRRKRNQPLSSNDITRALLSWLAGGSASQVADRAFVSRRTIYNIIWKYVYTRDPIDKTGRWHDIGLIECLVTPWCREIEDPTAQQVVCLICHQEIVSYTWFNPTLRVGEVFRPQIDGHLPAYINKHKAAEHTQGHLILHFWLEKTPDSTRISPLRRYFGNSVDSAWYHIPRGTGEYIGQNRWVRESMTTPLGPEISDSHERWQQWRRRILENNRVGPVPLETQAGRRYGYL
jgi:hypothetical protein